MYHLILCVLELLILLIIARIVCVVSNKQSGYMKDLRMSDPGVAAAIGNAANRNFENSQIGVGGMKSYLNKGYSTTKSVENTYIDPIAKYLQ